jgi:hypothetical protein
MVPVLVGRGDCRMQIETSLKRQVHRGLVWKSLALIMLSVVSNLLWERSPSRDCCGKNAAPTYRLDSFHTNPR